MGHTIDFFRDEVRNGFYIPTAIKQAWAETLDVLAEIDRVCEKHGIRYFADWGTFLGAVRHGGFVPWDDDLDICMLRDDYMRFRQVADKELEDGYVIHDYERKENHWLFLSRVVNNSKMCFEENYLRLHNNFPWLAGVDIFVKDYLYEDADKERRRDKDIMNILAVADGIIDGSLSDQAIFIHVNEIEKRYRENFPGKYRKHDLAVSLYKLAEQQMAQVKPDETERVGQIFPWVLKNGPDAGEDKRLYEKVIRLPFEDTTIPVPAAYNTVLARRYGNYCEIHKVWTGHDYPFFEGQKEEMKRLLGEELPGFSFDKTMLDRVQHDRSGSLKTIADECLKEMNAILTDAENILNGGSFTDFTQAISYSQQLAADFGTLVEQVKGKEKERTICVIAALQEYCDALWQEYQKVEGGVELNALPESRRALRALGESVKDNILDRKEILFLPIGCKEWTGLEKKYREVSDGNADIYVVPLPLMKKDYFGTVSMTDDEIMEAARISGYPKELKCEDWRTYDIALHCPDEIYVQNPYDETNPCLTVPPEFYVRKLQKFAEHITYIPAFKTAEFGADDINDQYNLKHYVCAPALLFADSVIVQSDNIKNQYVNALAEFAGEDTRPVWEKKIRVDASIYDISAVSATKRLLYCIGANELSEHGATIADGIKEKLRIIGEAGKDISVSVLIYPGLKNAWEEIDPILCGEIFKSLSGMNLKNDMGTNINADDAAEIYDAYYGSPSPYVPAFVTHQKPVMLASYA